MKMKIRTKKEKKTNLQFHSNYSRMLDDESSKVLLQKKYIKLKIWGKVKQYGTLIFLFYFRL